MSKEEKNIGKIMEEMLNRPLELIEENKKLKKKIEKLQKENEELKQDYIDLDKENRELKERNKYQYELLGKFENYVDKETIMKIYDEE